MPMRKPQKQQNKQKIKFIKIRKNPDIEVWYAPRQEDNKK